LEDECKSKGLGIVFEYPGSITPQRNGKVERMFKILYGRIRPMLNGTGLQEEIRRGIWADFASTSIFNPNILATIATKRFPQELLFGKEAHCAHFIRLFGDIGIIIQGKIMDQDTLCKFFEYPPNHACDIYRMLKQKKKHIIKSRVF
jgi:hypothetical protein